MIFEVPGPEKSIEQGDIFRGIPRLELDLERLPVASDDGYSEADWSDVCQENSQDAVTGLIAIRPVLAIVMSQDCDAVRANEIALAEIVRFEDMLPDIKQAAYPNKTWSLITKQSRWNLRWFYLPIDNTIGFAERMAADFDSVLRTSRMFLERHISQFRIAKLSDVAGQHFREKLSEYYRRYPFDEWYPLDKAEFEAYRKQHLGKTEPYPWQK